jgi:predicted RNA-binding Zn ribbon-like protein
VDLGYFGEGAQLAADLVNTKGWHSGVERLVAVDDVAAFMAEHGQSRRVTTADVPKFHALRDRVRDVFLAGDEALARERINALLADYPSKPRLAGAGEAGVTFEPVADDAVGWVGASAAFGLAFLVAEHGISRIGICGASDCFDAYVDESKNSNKHYCSSGCARLESVRAFRRRKRQADVV